MNHAVEIVIQFLLQRGSRFEVICNMVTTQLTRCPLCCCSRSQDSSWAWSQSRQLFSRWRIFVDVDSRRKLRYTSVVLRPALTVNNGHTPMSVSASIINLRST